MSNVNDKYESINRVRINQDQDRVGRLIDSQNKDIGTLIRKQRNFRLVRGRSIWASNLPFSKKVDSLVISTNKRVYAEIQNSVFASWKLGELKNDEQVFQYMRTLSTDKEYLSALAEIAQGKSGVALFLKGVDISSDLNEMLQYNIKAAEAFAKRTRGGFNISDRVWNLNKRTKLELENYLLDGIAEGKSANEMARSTQRYLKEPNKLFRRVRSIAGDPTSKLVLSKPAAAYHPGRGVYRSAFKNARRLAATETNMAYRAADFARIQKIPFVTGIEVKLSAAHPKFDICDDMAGKYPPGFHFPGWHALCFCYQISILLPKEKFLNFITSNNPSAIKYTGGIPSNATKYVARNNTKIMKAKTRAYWHEDNFTKAGTLKKTVIK